jgi:Translation elongation factors (GTPases)
LSLADAAVEVIATTKGERILACLGEIHLEQSILDLRNEYIGRDIELRISKPIVEFRESTAWFENEWDDFEHFYNQELVPLRQTLIPPYCEEDGLLHAKNGRSRTIVSGRGMALHVRVLPLPAEVHACLENKAFQEQCSEDLIRLGKALNINSSSPNELFDKLLELVASIDSHGNAFLESEGVQSGFCVKGVVCRPKEPKEVYMPRVAQEKNVTDNGNKVEADKDGFQEQSSKIDIAKSDYEEMKGRICCRNVQDEIQLKDSKAFRVWKDEFRGSLVGGFQSGCAAGPLCEEPIRGIVVILEGIEMAMYERRKKTGKEDDYNLAHPISGGMVVAALRTGIRTSILTRPVRLMEGHLKLTLHSSLSALGPLYDVLSRRRGRVISDAMVEGTDLISIEATLPQSESFGLTSELMKKSSGQVTAPELVFSHWEMLDEDPFWIPTSLEEREDYGEIVLNGDISTGIANTALKFIRSIRERKGLIVDSHKIVVAAEKQRTLARKK